MQRTHLTRVLAVATAGVMLVAGCTSDESPVAVTVTATSPPETTQAEPSPSPSPSETMLPDESPPADEAPFVADRQPDTAAASADAFLSPVGLRFGVHEGFDRIVLDLVGQGTPGWRGEYVDDPTQQAAGEPVYLLGKAYLLVMVHGVAYPTEEGARSFQGPGRIIPDNSGIVEEVRYGSMFEGQVEIWVGLASDEPFRVFSLEDPTRVVIDVQHP